MKFSKDTVDYIAKLARLELTKEENDKFTNELTNIVEYVEKLNELDISNVEPTNHILDVKNVLREDEIEKNYSREENLQNAPKEDDGCFVVPKIVE